MPPRNMVCMSIGPNTRVEDQLGLSYSLDDAVNILETLEPILTVGLKPLDAASMSSLSDDEEKANPLNLTTIPTPTLKTDQIALAMQVVPEEYWTINCCVCRDNGQSMYRCPFLVPAQRLYFAYRYYLWQVQQQPHMRKFLADRAAARQQRRVQAGQPAAPATPARVESTRPRSTWGSVNAGPRPSGDSRPWLPPTSPRAGRRPRFAPQDRVHIINRADNDFTGPSPGAVSYTHLTLPTILLV